jgi:putative Mg2+ transporter-C (MgtC) family protein
VSQVKVEREASAVGGREADDSLDAGDSADVGGAAGQTASSKSRRIVTVALEVQGTRSVARLAAKLADIPGVVRVNAGDSNIPADEGSP